LERLFLKYYKRTLLLIFLIGFIIFLHFVGINKYLNFETFKQNKGFLIEYVNNNYYLSVLIYIVIYILIVISTLPLAALSTVISGFIFGVFWGSIYSIIAGTIGATISFLILRYLVGSYFQKRFSNKLKKFNDDIKNYGAIYSLILHFAGIFPFFVINVLSALTNLSLFTFVWTTAVGIIPGTLVNLCNLI